MRVYSKQKPTRVHLAYHTLTIQCLKREQTFILKQKATGTLVWCQ